MKRTGRALTGDKFPPAPLDRLSAAAEAVLRSCKGRNALEYCRIHRLGAPADTAVILVCEDISTGDVSGIASAAGILIACGVRTADAAVVAGQMGKACLAGYRELAALASWRTRRSRSRARDRRSQIVQQTAPAPDMSHGCAPDGSFAPSRGANRSERDAAAPCCMVESPV